MLKNIIFTGGGLKGWAYIGTIRALNELVDICNIEHVIATSIGSVFALFYISQIKWDYLLDFIINLDFKEVLDIDIDNILTTQSLLEGKKFYLLIKRLMSINLDPDITFMELYNKTKILYTVNSFNISKCECDYFNYQNTPDIKVLDAIMASCSIPLLFPSYNINNNYYYDGGLINNCAFQLVDELETIIFELNINSENTQNNKNNKLMELLISVLNFIQNKVASNANINNYILVNLVNDKYKDDLFNINQTKDDIFNIYMNGYLNSKKVIYDSFIALPDIIN